jgi:hypothetical protein
MAILGNETFTAGNEVAKHTDQATGHHKNSASASCSSAPSQ